MKWRNQILALFCLAIFIAFGVLYFRHWVVQKPFAIVLFVGEGLTPDRIAATRLYTGGANAHLAIDNDQLIAYTKQSDDRSDLVLVVVRLEATS